MQNKFSAKELLVAEWIKRGEDDEQNVRSILLHRDGTPNAVCLLSHQMAEKYLKAFLILTKKCFPKIHPLDKLVELCEEVEPSFRELKDAAADASLLALRIKEFVLAQISVYEKKQESGFGIISLLIAVAIIALVGGGGLYMREIRQRKVIEQIGIEEKKSAEMLKQKIEQQKQGQIMPDEERKPVSTVFGNEAEKLCGPQPPVICRPGMALGCRIADKQWDCYPQ